MLFLKGVKSEGKEIKVFDLYGWHALKGLKPIQAARPERAEALSPGQRPGYKGRQQGAL